MAVRTLSYKTLGELDGGIIAIAMDSELERVIADCRDREGENKPRKITLELLISPLTDQCGHADDVETQFVIKSVVPSRRTKAYRMGMKRDNSVYYQEDSLDAPDQSTLAYSEDGDDA